jgi:hypothetical protein
MAGQGGEAFVYEDCIRKMSASQHMYRMFGTVATFRLPATHVVDQMLSTPVAQQLSSTPITQGHYVSQGMVCVDIGHPTRNICIRTLPAPCRGNSRDRETKDVVQRFAKVHIRT